MRKSFVLIAIAGSTMLASSVVIAVPATAAVATLTVGDKVFAFRPPAYSAYPNMYINLTVTCDKNDQGVGVTVVMHQNPMTTTHTARGTRSRLDCEAGKPLTVCVNANSINGLNHFVLSPPDARVLASAKTTDMKDPLFAPEKNVPVVHGKEVGGKVGCH